MMVLSIKMKLQNKQSGPVCQIPDMAEPQGA